MYTNIFCEQFCGESKQRDEVVAGRTRWSCLYCKMGAIITICMLMENVENAARGRGTLQDNWTTARMVGKCGSSLLITSFSIHKRRALPPAEGSRATGRRAHMAHIPVLQVKTESVPTANPTADPCRKMFYKEFHSCCRAHHLTSSL